MTNLLNHGKMGRVGPDLASHPPHTHAEELASAQQAAGRQRIPPALTEP